MVSWEWLDDAFKLGREIIINIGANVEESSNLIKLSICPRDGGGDGGLDNCRARLREMVSEITIYSEG